VEIEIPDDLQILELLFEDLPKGWDSKPPQIETQFIGDDFVEDANAPILKVPSSIIPFEYNYLINPNHPEAKRITVISQTPLKFDERLWSKK
jgi:RES domain-containing protein